MKYALRSVITLVLALVASSLHAQLIYSSDSSGVAIYNAYKADTPFVNATLLNLTSVTSFTKGSLTFNLIPNLDPTHPSDIQVAPGFTFDIQALASNHADVDNFGSESSLLGAGNQSLYPNFGPSSTLTWHITGSSLTDVILWTQDSSMTGAFKFTMDDANIFRTYTAVDTNFTYYIFAIDDRGSLPGSDHDYNDVVVGARINNLPVGVIDAVPEPSTYGLAGATALLGLVMIRRQRQQASAVA